jgi:hypothetical protein
VSASSPGDRPPDGRPAPDRPGASRGRRASSAAETERVDGERRPGPSPEDQQPTERRAEDHLKVECRAEHRVGPAEVAVGDQARHGAAGGGAEHGRQQANEGGQGQQGRQRRRQDGQRPHDDHLGELAGHHDPAPLDPVGHRPGERAEQPRQGVGEQREPDGERAGTADQ